MNRGQLISIDFILATAIFVIALLMLSELWGDLSREVYESLNTWSQQNTALAISDAVLLSTGNPYNWTESNVNSIGLAVSPRVISSSKFIELRNIPDLRASVLFDAWGYNISMNLTDPEGGLFYSGVSVSPVAYFSSSSTSWLEELNSSSLVWDFFWSGAGPAPSALNRSGSSSVFQNLLFSQLLNSSSEYRTIIVDSNELSFSSINSTQVSDYVLGGGTLVIRGPSGSGDNLVSVFNVSEVPVPAGSSIEMVSNGDFLNSPSGAGSVSADSVAIVNSSSVSNFTPLIVLSSNNSVCVAAQFSYGFGTVYYISTTSGAVNGTPFSSIVYWVGTPFSFGPSVEGWTSIVVHRTGILEKDNGKRYAANLNLVVWK